MEGLAGGRESARCCPLLRCSSPYSVFFCAEGPVLKICGRKFTFVPRIEREAAVAQPSPTHASLSLDAPPLSAEPLSPADGLPPLFATDDPAASPTPSTPPPSQDGTSPGAGLDTSPGSPEEPPKATSAESVGSASPPSGPSCPPQEGLAASNEAANNSGSGRWFGWLRGGKGTAEAAAKDVVKVAVQDTVEPEVAVTDPVDATGRDAGQTPGNGTLEAAPEEGVAEGDATAVAAEGAGEAALEEGLGASVENEAEAPPEGIPQNDCSVALSEGTADANMNV